MTQKSLNLEANCSDLVLSVVKYFNRLFHVTCTFTLPHLRGRRCTGHPRFLRQYYSTRLMRFHTGHRGDVEVSVAGFRVQEEAAGSGQDGVPTQHHATAQLHPTVVPQGHLETENEHTAGAPVYQTIKAGTRAHLSGTSALSLVGHRK